MAKGYPNQQGTRSGQAVRSQVIAFREVAIVAPYKHVKVTTRAYIMSVEEIEAINNGGVEVSWKKVKPIKI